MTDFYRKVFEWGHQNGAHLSTQQARDLLVSLGLEGDGDGTYELSLTVDDWVLENDGGRRERDMAWLANSVWHMAQVENRLPLELPRITEEHDLLGSGVVDLPVTRFVVRMRARKVED